MDLSLEEKIKLLVGDPKDAFKTNSLGGKIYAIKMGDGPNGPHFPKSFTWLPSINSLACSWDKELVKEYADVIADECIINDLDILLGPAINIKRLPTCGRNFEYFSEDPLITGELAKQYISSLQDRGVGTCIKHFALNNREDNRLYVDVKADKRAIREIYTKGFEIALEAKPVSLMCSYNSVNGQWAAENEYLLKELLRDTFHYNGVIVSDWGAVHDRANSLKATLDLEMPFMEFRDSYESLKNGLKEGLYTENDINQSVERIQKLISIVNENKNKRIIQYTKEERHNIATKVAEEGVVLLKNEDNILPLQNKPIQISVFGGHSIEPELGGGGSGNLGNDARTPFKEEFRVKQESLSDLLQKKLNNATIHFNEAYNYQEGFGSRYQTNLGGIKRLATLSDVCIAYLSTNRCIECEGYDRESLDLPKGQLDMLETILKYNKNVIVIITGSALNTSSFKDKVKAILYTGFGGEGINEGLSNILVGKVNPSGKLIETFVSSVDVNPYLNKGNRIEEEIYEDSIYVGYRLYEKENIKVDYPFGYGLSYTTFEYSNLKIDGFNISFTITNTGDIDGKEAYQLYIRPINPKVERPIKELKEFGKIYLKSQQKADISLKLNDLSLAYFDEKSNDWKVDKGQYEIMIGSSSQDIKLKEILTIK